MKKILFFGLGSIGRRHAELVRDNYPFELYAFRSGAGQGKNGLGIQEIYDWKEVDRLRPEVAFITNPTFLHVQTAIRCAERGMDLFIEKPVASSLKHLDKLLRVVARRGVATYVAYVLRFHPVIQEFKRALARSHFLHMRVSVSSYLPLWRKGRSSRQTYSARSAMGGGVLYDLSHELDYTRYLLGNIRSIKAVFARRSEVTVDAEDYADLLVEAESGPANLHMSFASQMEQRVLQVDFKEKSIVGDLLDFTVTEYRRGKIERKKRLRGSRDDCFKRQLAYFFSNLRNRRMMNNIFEASDLFKKLHAIRRNHG